MQNKLRSIDLLLFSEAYKRILNYFFSFPSQSIGLNDLSQAIKVSKTSAREAVLKLERMKFLNKEEIGKTWRITSNPNHPFLITRKFPLSLQTIYESGAVDLIREKYPSAKAIILFGSFRNGTDNEKSDIDIAVEIITNREPKIEQLGIIEGFGYRTKVPINLFIFSRNKVNTNVFNNIANGVVLDGFLEVKI
ncbi:MAG: nucleotidyltransferase domain-containing protein [Nanoarchaeota archaeon]